MGPSGELFKLLNELNGTALLLGSSEPVSGQPVKVVAVGLVRLVRLKHRFRTSGSMVGQLAQAVAPKATLAGRPTLEEKHFESTWRTMQASGRCYRGRFDRKFEGFQGFRSGILGAICKVYRESVFSLFRGERMCQEGQRHWPLEPPAGWCPVDSSVRAYLAHLAATLLAVWLTRARATLETFSKT